MAILNSTGENISLFLITFVSGGLSFIHSFFIIGKHKGLCFSLDFPSLDDEIDLKSFIGILFAVALICLDVLLLIATVVLNISSVYIILKSGKASGRQHVKRQEKIFMIRSILVSVSNFLSWAVVLPVAYSSLTGYTITSQVLDWIISVGLPLNSLLNPIVYTFSTEQFKTYFSKRFKHHSTHTKPAMNTDDVTL